MKLLIILSALTFFKACDILKQKISLDKYNNNYCAKLNSNDFCKLSPHRKIILDAMWKKIADRMDRKTASEYKVSIYGYLYHEKSKIKNRWTIGSGTIIMDNVTIEENVEIGEDCVVGSYSYIFSNTSIGRRNFIGQYCKFGKVTLNRNHNQSDSSPLYAQKNKKMLEIDECNIFFKNCQVISVIKAYEFSIFSTGALLSQKIKTTDFMRDLTNKATNYLDIIKKKDAVFYFFFLILESSDFNQYNFHNPMENMNPIAINHH